MLHKMKDYAPDYTLQEKCEEHLFATAKSYESVNNFCFSTEFVLSDESSMRTSNPERSKCDLQNEEKMGKEHFFFEFQQPME